MKNTLRITVSLLLVAVMLFCVVSCAEKVDATGLWEDAKYLSDTTLGEGENTVKVLVVCEDQSITFTIKTDKDNLGDALYEHELINDPSFFDVCNGMKADWDKDNAYWAFYIDGEYALTGVEKTKIEEGKAYAFKVE